MNPLDVLVEVNAACEKRDTTSPRFDAWGADALVDAHRSPTMMLMLRRVLPSDRRAHQESGRVPRRQPSRAAGDCRDLRRRGRRDGLTHDKEEDVLFPYIEKLELAVRRREPAPGAMFGSVDRPIAMMELEHEHAGQAMERIREISKNYALPGGACITYAMCSPRARRVRAGPACARAPGEQCALPESPRACCVGRCCRRDRLAGAERHQKLLRRIRLRFAPHDGHDVTKDRLNHRSSSCRRALVRGNSVRRHHRDGLRRVESDPNQQETRCLRQSSS